MKIYNFGGFLFAYSLCASACICKLYQNGTLCHVKRTRLIQCVNLLFRKFDTQRLGVFKENQVLESAQYEFSPYMHFF